jgi:hypothetical protein
MLIFSCMKLFYYFFFNKYFLFINKFKKCTKITKFTLNLFYSIYKKYIITEEHFKQKEIPQYSHLLHIKNNSF